MIRWLLAGVERLSIKAFDFGSKPAYMALLLCTIGFFMGFNTDRALRPEWFDPYPFLLLNLVLSLIAAVFQPLNMMAVRILSEVTDKRDREAKEAQDEADRIHREADEHHMKWTADVLRSSEVTLLGVDTAIQGMQHGMEEQERRTNEMDRKLDILMQHIVNLTAQLSQAGPLGNSGTDAAPNSE